MKVTSALFDWSTCFVCAVIQDNIYCIYELQKTF